MRHAQNIIATVALAVLGLNFYWLYSTRSGYVKIVTHNEGVLQSEFLAERAEKQLSITISPSLDEICDQKQWHQPWFLDPATALLLGKRRMHRTFLTIGIASVERQERYLEQTLDSLLEKSTDTERENVTLVIFLADMDLNVRKQRTQRIQEAYEEVLNSGFLQVIQAPPCIYPNLDFRSSRRTYGDTPDRVHWRAKQVLDFAYLMSYCQNISDYYMVLEDDLVCADHYLTAIREFIKLHSDHYWIALQFSGFYAIGQTLHNEDLSRLVTLLKIFYKEQPVDFLIQHFIRLLVPDSGKPTRRIPSLFQHQGLHSTLMNKTQKLKDTTFNAVPPRSYHVTNPPADLITSMQTYSEFRPEYAYSPAPGKFWGIPKPGDTFDIVFPQAVVLNRVAVQTGDSNRNPPDRLTDGELQASDVFLAFESPGRVLCRGFITLASFVDGKVDITNLDKVFPTGVQCLRIKVGSKQNTWIIVTEIAVFVNSTAS